MQQTLINQKIENGFIHARVVLEIAGQPKAHVENTLLELLTKIKESDAYQIVKEDFAECVEQGQMFSQFVELEFLVKGTDRLFGFCFDFMPSSVELIAPPQLTAGKEDLSSIMNDLQAKLHTLDMVTKKTVSENNFLKRNFNHITRNLLSLVLYKKELPISEISAVSGLPEPELQQLLTQMITEKKVQQVGDKYTLSLGVKNEEPS